MAAAFHAAMSARVELPEELRAAHVCAAVAIAAKGQSTHADGWHFAVKRDALGTVEREVARKLALRYAHDPRAAAACGSISGYSNMTLVWNVLIAAVIVVVLLTLIGPMPKAPRKIKSTRAEALAALAALPESAPKVDRRVRHSNRHRRPARACACDVGCTSGLLKLHTVRA